MVFLLAIFKHLISASGIIENIATFKNMEKDLGITNHTFKGRYDKSNDSRQMHISKNTVNTDLNYEKRIGTVHRFIFFLEYSTYYN